MPGLQDDVSSLFKVVLRIIGFGKQVTESYLLKAMGSTGAYHDATRQIAMWRAATLPSDATLKDACLSEIGPARKGFTVIDYPVQGTIGVKFAANEELATKMHTLATGLRFKLQTLQGDFIARTFRGVCDGWVNAYKWQGLDGNANDDFFDTVGIDQPLPTNLTEPEALPFDRYMFGGLTMPSAATQRNMVTYDQAWKNFLRALFQHTDYKRATSETDVLKGGSYSPIEWHSFVYRGVTDRLPGLPQSR